MFILLFWSTLYFRIGLFSLLASRFRLTLAVVTADLFLHVAERLFVLLTLHWSTQTNPFADLFGAYGYWAFYLAKYVGELTSPNRRLRRLPRQVPRNFGVPLL